MKLLSMFAIGLFLCALALQPAWSQTAQIDGKVTDAGKPVPGASVVFTNPSTSRNFKVKADKNGAFSMLGVPYGDYEVAVSSATGEKLFQQKNSIVPPDGGGPVVLKLDISQNPSNSQSGTQAQTGQGSAQQPKYTKEQIEEMQKQKEKAENTNTLIKQAIDDMNAKNWTAALPILQQLVASDPNNWQYQQALGNTALSLEQYDQAAAAYAKGIQAAESITTVDPKNPLTDPTKKKLALGQMYTNEGNALLKLKRNKEAVDAFTKAANIDPNPDTAYFNLCATQYNTGNAQGALEACDKAIAANPNRADAYFIKGSLLIGESKMDSSGRLAPPPGTAEALNKYLELEPNGPHVNDVKQMLEAIGSKVETTYKKKGK